MNKSVSQIEQELITALLADLLDKADPPLSAGLLVASVPHNLDQPLFSLLRGRHDEQDAAIYGRLRRLQFFGEADREKIKLPGLHRAFLHKQFVDLNRAGLIETHQRAAAFWEEDALQTAHEKTQNLIFHRLLAGGDTADPTQVDGLGLMVGRFRQLADQNDIPAIERLLLFLGQTRVYLSHFDPPWLLVFDDLVALMNARLEQLRGDFATSAEVLAPVMARRDVVPDHAPYLLRTHGENLAHQQNFAGAIELYKEALTRLEKEIVQRKVVNLEGGEWAILEAERADVMVAMGDAHLGLALAARGDRLPRLPRTRGDRLRSWGSTLLSLPLVMYLTYYFGWRAWRAELWTAIGSEDWMVIRLCASAHRWYQRAKPMAQNYGSERDNVRLAEKIAKLYLELGDWSMAQQEYEKLWHMGPAELGEYRRGHVALGLADATFQIGNTGQAFVLVEEAVIIFDKYKDVTFLAKSQALLARILGEMRNYAAALSSYNQAFRAFEVEENWIDGTHLAEHLEMLVQREPSFPEALKEQAIRLCDSLLKRQYGRQYLHPSLNRWRLTQMASFALMVIAIPLLVMTMSESTGILPISEFNPGHLLDLDQPVAVEISSGLLETAGVKPLLLAEVTVLAKSALLTLLGYTLFLLGGGLVFLLAMPVDSVELDGKDDLITLDRNGIVTGSKDHEVRLNWADIQELVRANLAFVKHIPLYASSFGVKANGAHLTIRGRTAWFTPLQRRIEWQAVDATVKGLDYTVGRSGMLMAYLVGIVTMVGYLALGWLASDRLWQPVGGLALRTADLHAWLFMALFLPPVWWGLVVRWRHKLALHPRSSWPWALLIGGAGLTLLQLATRLRPLLTVPDIYLPLLTILLLAGGGLFVWQVRELGQRVYSWRLRVPVLLVALIFAGLNGARVARDVRGWSHVVVARSFVKQGEALEDPVKAEPLFRMARANFTLARQVQNMPISWLAEEEAFEMPLGIPRRQALVSTQAILGEGAMAAQLGDYEVAIVAFKQGARILRLPQQQGMLNSWIGVARQSDRPTEADRFALVRENYERALEDFGWAFELDPAGDNYLLYKGFSYHTLGELNQAHDNYRMALDREEGRGLSQQERAQAYIGLGWVLYEQKNYGGALLQFEQGILAAREVNLMNPQNPAAERELADAEMGFGYTVYALGQYDLAERSFTVARELLPNDPEPLVALGMVNLRLGTFAHDVTRGNDVCLLNDASAETKEDAKQHYIQSAEYLTLAAEKLNQTDNDIAQIFRTRGQAHFLLRHCPGMVLDEQLAAGSQSYTRAISYDSENDNYWQLRARFGMSRWLNGQQASELEPVLFRALADIRQAMKLNPENSTNDDWYNSIFEQVALITGRDAVLAWEAAIDAAEGGATAGLTPLDFTGCYSAQFISQNASTYIPKSNQLFRVTWTLANRGSCVWDDEIRFRHVANERMGAQEIVSIPFTRPGEVAEITVAFVAPPEPGNYRGEWVLVDGTGAEISGRQWFVVEVK